MENAFEFGWRKARKITKNNAKAIWLITDYYRNSKSIFLEAKIWIFREVENGKNATKNGFHFRRSLLLVQVYSNQLRATKSICDMISVHHAPAPTAQQHIHHRALTSAKNAWHLLPILLWIIYLVSGGYGLSSALFSAVPSISHSTKHKLKKIKKELKYKKCRCTFCSLFINTFVHFWFAVVAIQREWRSRKRCDSKKCQ